MNDKSEVIPFEEMIQNMNIGVFRLSGRSRHDFVFVNRAFSQMIGCSVQEARKVSTGDLFEKTADLRLLLREAARLGQATRSELVLKAKGRRKIQCAVSLRAVRDERGRIVCYDGLAEDVTNEKRVAKELEESRELFKTVFNKTAAAIMVTDKEDNIIAWNPFTEELLGMDQRDLFNKPVKDLYPDSEWRQMRTFKIKQKGFVPNIETQVFRKDGTILLVNLSISIIKDADGRVTGSIGIMQDITRQKIAERKIKEEENKIRIILDNSAAGIMLTDELNRIVSWNRYTEQMLAMKKSDLHMQPASIMYPREEWKKVQKALSRKGSSSHHMETKILRKDGKEVDVWLSINLLKDPVDNITGSVGIIQDITEQKRVRQILLEAKTAAEEASNAKSLFLANMSHEVRTPMNTIMGMLDLTLDTKLEEEQRDNLMTAKTAADILLSLLNDILDLSRVEAGKVQLEQIQINIRNIVSSVCKGLSVLARNKNVDLVWEVEDNVPEVVLGDPVRLRQVLVNLINNSIKFTSKGAIRLGVGLKARKHSICELIFSVQDDGIGIAKDKLESIFEVFTQADASTTRRFGGTGLGLAISKKLVEMMSGRIWAESEEKKGSTFYFTGKFEGVRAEAVSVVGVEESIEDELLANLPKEKVKHLKILLAEDNLVNQKIAARMLEKKGWTVKCVEDGQKALEALEKDKFDLILMDAQMPVLDGFAATAIIRDREKGTGQRIPIVALTARAMTGDKEKCLEAGMDYYVSKPIDRKLFYETIENVFLKRKV